MLRFTLAVVLAVSSLWTPCLHALEAPIPKSALQNGSAFTSAANRALQEDDFANPGMLWVERGERLWKAPPNDAAKSCQGCHGDASSSMKGVATRYPRVDPGAARLVDVAGRVNICRERHQRSEPFAPESESLLALAAYVTVQSRGMPMDVRDRHSKQARLRARTRPVLSAARSDESFVRAVSRPQLGTDTPARDGQPGARHRASRRIARSGRAWDRSSAASAPAIRVCAPRCRRMKPASCCSSNSSSRGDRTAWRSKRRVSGARLKFFLIVSRRMRKS